MTIRRFVELSAVSLSLCFALAPSSAEAQAAPRTVAVANIPFSFEYSGKVLPAGRYEIRTLQNNFLVLNGSTERAVGLVRREDPFRTAEHAKLVFRTDGRDIVLKDVWVPSIQAHLVCSQRKHPAAQEMARGRVAPPTVTVAMLETAR